MRKILIVVLALVVSFSMISVSFADIGTNITEANDDSVIIYAKIDEAETKVKDKVDMAFSNPDVETVEVIYSDDLLSIDKKDSMLLENKNSIAVQSASSPIYYYVKNVKRILDYKSSSDIAVASGGPGVTLGISKTKTISTTFSATFGASVKAISAAIGWNIVGSTSISVSGSAKVPARHNGKKVKSMTLHAKTIYKVKTYDVYKNIPGYVNKKTGTGNTKKAYGVAFSRTYKYK